MKFYKRYPGDIMKKTSGLTMAQFGAYDRLIDWCYANEKPVDPEEVYIITHAQTPADRRDVDRVLAKFFTLQPDGYRQERIEEVIADAMPKIQAARENGKLGGRPKKPTGLFSETYVEPKPKAIQEPDPDSSSPTSKKKAPKLEAWSPPDWVPAVEWGQFVEHRKAMHGVPFTDAARDGVVRELAKFKAKGHDPADLLSTAITRGWRTVFEPKSAVAFGHSIQTITVPSDGPARTAAYLAQQAENAAKATPPPPEILALRSKRSVAA